MSLCGTLGCEALGLKICPGKLRKTNGESAGSDSLAVGREEGNILYRDSISE